MNIFIFRHNFFLWISQTSLAKRLGKNNWNKETLLKTIKTIFEIIITIIEMLMKNNNNNNNNNDDSNSNKDKKNNKHDTSEGSVAQRSWVHNPIKKSPFQILFSIFLNKNSFSF